MPRARTLALLLAWSFLGGVAAHAGDEADAQPLIQGSRVRVVSDSGRIQGTVLQLDEDTLILGVDGTRLAVPRASIAELELWTGRRRQTLRGLWIGAAAGALLGALDPCVNEGCGGRASSDFVLIGLAGGAMWGAAIGALVQTDIWTPVAPDRLRVTVAPGRHGGAAVSLAIRF